MCESRLRWQCRRGMRELDALLLGYLECCYPAADAGEKSAFRALLALPDSRLIDYLLLGNAVGEPELTDVVRCIRSRADTG